MSSPALTRSPTLTFIFWIRPVAWAPILTTAPTWDLMIPVSTRTPRMLPFSTVSGVQDLGGRLDKEYSPDHNGRQQKRDGDTGKEDDFFLRRERFDRCEIHG